MLIDTHANMLLFILLLFFFQIMPSYFASLHAPEAAPQFLEFAITQLGSVVSSSRILMKDHLPEIFKVIRTLWDAQLVPVRVYTHIQKTHTNAHITCTTLTHACTLTHMHL